MVLCGHLLAHPPDGPADRGRVKDSTWANTRRYVMGIALRVVLAYFPAQDEDSVTVHLP